MSCCQDRHWFPVFEQLLSRMGAPLIRTALKQVMQYLAQQFVFADSIQQAVQRSEQETAYRYSFDMLGEAALTARRCRTLLPVLSFGDYNSWLNTPHPTDIYANPGISIKLSALCPRYEPLQHVRAVKELTDKLLTLAQNWPARPIFPSLSMRKNPNAWKCPWIFLPPFLRIPI